MSYQVLARKWRPYQFSDVVGQSHVLKALGNALDHNRLHHAYLFSGTRGVGKTTIARIFAKGLNCEQGVSATPCGQCVSCVEIEQGRCVDLLEIDAASRTKVEDTRELLDNVQYKPARCRYKIYLIDEVHMLSRHSFNALLKTLEEPPEYVKFILATTDPQKLPITILSRCLQFHLKHLQPEQIKNQLAYVLQQEQIVAEPRALSLLAHAADGSMRDALSLTDQAIALGGGLVSDEQVSEMLGTISTDKALVLIETLVKADAKQLFDLLAQFTDIGMEWDSLLKELSLQLQRIALAQMLEESIDKSAPDAERLLMLAKQLNPQDVQLYYQIVLQGRQDLPYAPNSKSGFEMVMIRLLAFKPADVAPVPISSASGQNQSTSHNETPTTTQMKPAQSQRSAPSFDTDTTNTTNAQLATEQSALMVNKPKVVSENAPALTIPTHQQADGLAVQTASVETQDSPNPVAKPVNPLVAARNLLRNQSRQHSDSEKKTSIKKPEAMLSTIPALSAIASSPAVQIEAKAKNKPEEYRWQSSVSLPENKQELSTTPENIKSVLSHERTKAMRNKLEQEAIKQDAWSNIISHLSISQISKQLALNAAMQQQNNEITLFLRQSQSHLNNEKNRMELTHALSERLGDITLNVLLDDTKGVTPLEWRDNIYAEKLATAVKSLHADSNIRFICEHYAATLNEDSIRPI